MEKSTLENRCPICNEVMEVGCQNPLCENFDASSFVPEIPDDEILTNKEPVCPTCGGSGKIYEKPSFDQVSCPTCKR